MYVAILLALVGTYVQHVQHVRYRLQRRQVAILFSHAHTTRLEGYIIFFPVTGVSDSRLLSFASTIDQAAVALCYAVAERDTKPRGAIWQSTAVHISSIWGPHLY